MDHPVDPIDAPPAWVALLIESKGAVERGEIVPLDPVLERMRASIARIEAGQTSEPHPEA